jgi:endonuclease YncB( thermonuclease family)
VLAIERGHELAPGYVPSEPRSAAATPPAGKRGAKGAAAPAKTGDNLAGTAIVTAALEINVEGKPLRLYGVKPPETSDRCQPGPNYAARSCPDVSRDALAEMLRSDSRVSCHVLGTGSQSVLPAVCADDKGRDIASYLVGNGLALADPSETADYSGPEKQARLTGAGLWHYR